MKQNFSIAVVEKCADRLAFYDAGTGSFEGAIALPHYPHEMARDPDGRHAYVGHYGALNSSDPAQGGSAVIVVDLTTRCIVSEIDLRPYRRLHGLQCDAAGRLFVLAEADDVLLIIDAPKTAKLACRAARTGGIKGHLLAVTKDGETAFCAHLLSHTVTRVAPFSGKLAPVIIEPGPRPEGMCLSVDEKRLLVLNRGDGTIAEIDVMAGVVQRVVSLRGEATRIYRHGAEAFLVASYIDESISMLDADTLKELAYLKLGGRVTAVSLHPERPEALASLETDEIIRIDLDHFTEIARYPTGRDPDVSTFVRRAP
jgi:DNA-binding beta-propeller fold protein YncE